MRVGAPVSVCSLRGGRCTSQSHCHCRSQSAQLTPIQRERLTRIRRSRFLTILVARSACPESRSSALRVYTQACKVGPHVHSVSLHHENSGWIVQRGRSCLIFVSHA